MDTTQLKMVIDAVNQLGGSAQFAFYLWVLVNNIGFLLVWIVVVGGLLTGLRMVLRALRDSDSAEKALQIIRSGLEFASYEDAQLVTYIMNNVKPRGRA